MYFRNFVWRRIFENSGTFINALSVGIYLEKESCGSNIFWCDSN